MPPKISLTRFGDLGEIVRDFYLHRMGRGNECEMREQTVKVITRTGAVDASEFGDDDDAVSARLSVRCSRLAAMGSAAYSTTKNIWGGSKVQGTVGRRVLTASVLCD